jgi:fumarate reductase flavoprotein subunit
VQDVPQQHYEDMALFADARGLLPKDNLDLRRLLVEHLPDTLEWLTSLGVVFFGPMPEPPHRLPRMHNVLPHSRSYVYHLAKAARSLGVEIWFNARARKLVREGDRVVGVEVDIDGSSTRVIARRAVVLATGDYSAAQDMKVQYMSEQLAEIEGINPTSTGDGQRLVQEVGGEIVNGDVMLGPEIRFVAPPRRKVIERIPPVKPIALLMRVAMRYAPSWLLRPFLMMFVTTNLAPSHRVFQQGAILINKEGKRFVDECKNPELAIPRQAHRVAYIVMDDKVAQKFCAWPNYISTAPGVAYAYLQDYRRNRKDICIQSRSVAELAAKLDIPVDALANTIADYNRSLSDGARAIDRAPFYALGPVRSWIVLTDGGARVNSKLEVQDQSGKSIPHLYAAGSAGQGGLLLEGHGHHLGWAFTSGRLAGRNAALGAEAWSDAAVTTSNATVHCMKSEAIQER